MRRIVVLAVLFGVIACADDSAITFEAASIKPFPEGSPVSMSGCQGGPGSGDPGRINCEYVTLRMLLMQAYKRKNPEIFGPAWMESAHFNLMAKLPVGATKDQVPVMFRNLLAERFKMEVHPETRQLPGYALTIGKNGSKLHDAVPPAAEADDAKPAGKPPIGADGFPSLRPSLLNGNTIILYREGRARFQGGGIKMPVLADALARQLDRFVTDETGLDGKYDITLYWTPELTEPGARQQPAAHGNNPNTPPEAASPEPNLFAALEQQLGLKLAAKRVPRETIVVDRAEKLPTEN